MEAPLVQPCVTENHHFNEFHCVVLEVLNAHKDEHSDLCKRLLQREIFWITRLKTLNPLGLNQGIDYSVFL